MNMRKTLSLIAVGLAIAVGSFIKPAHAADNVNLDLNVAISATKEVTTNTTFYQFGAIQISSHVVASSSFTITNNSTALIETYTIQGSTAISDTVGTNWNLVSSTNSVGSETYALAALFSGSTPDNQEASWLSDDLNKDTPVTCTTTVLGNGVAAESGASVNPAAQRGLWFRIGTPTTTGDGGPHTITVNLSVL